MASTDLTPDQKLILTELSLPITHPAGPVIPYIWTKFQYKVFNAVYEPVRMRFLHTKREIIDMLLGGVWDEVDIDLGPDSFDMADQTANLQEIRQNVQDEIDRIYKRAQGLRAGQIAPITTQEPAAVLAGAPDPNDSIYKGDPQKRLRLRNP